MQTPTTADKSNDQTRVWNAQVKWTKVPKLDAVVRQELVPSTKKADQVLAGTQAKILDAVSPMVHILEEAQKGTLSADAVVKAAQAAITLLGNAVTHRSRSKALRDLNEDLEGLSDVEAVFEGATLNLFREKFPQRSKDYADQVKALRKAKHPPICRSSKRILNKVVTVFLLLFVCSIFLL